MHAGRVTDKDKPTGFGNIVFVQHPEGKVSSYAHMSKIDVEVGQQVTGAEKLGVAGDIAGETNYVAESHHKYPMVSINVDDLYYGGSMSSRKNDRIFETEGEYESMTVPWGDYNPVEGDLTPGPSCKVYFKGRK